MYETRGGEAYPAPGSETNICVLNKVYLIKQVKNQCSGFYPRSAESRPKRANCVLNKVYPIEQIKTITSINISPAQAIKQVQNEHPIPNPRPRGTLSRRAGQTHSTTQPQLCG